MVNSISEISSMISRFVESRIVDSPTQDDIDIWFEKVYAALFSCGFNLFLRLAYTSTESEEEFNKKLSSFINGIAEHSVQSGLKPSVKNRLTQNIVEGSS